MTVKQVHEIISSLYEIELINEVGGEVIEFNRNENSVIFHAFANFVVEEIAFNPKNEKFKVFLKTELRTEFVKG